MNYEKRVCVLYCGVVLCAAILLARLYNLSKPETNKSLEVLEGQYTGRIDVCERSGFVYDRDGYVISHNLVGKTVLVNPAECNDALLYADKLSEHTLVSDTSDIYEKIMDGIPFTLSVKCIEQDICLDGVYNFDLYEENTDIAKHFLGYNNVDGKGISGLRRAYGDFLGNKLYSKVSASFDTNAKRISLSPFMLNKEKYLSQDGIVTTLDKDVQIFCDSLGGEIKSGAVVVTEINNGKILAMSSFPSYDAKNIAAVLNSDKGELINRAAESFTPGSVFKMVIAAAALEKDQNLFDHKYNCTGKIEAGDGVFRCHKLSGHGEISMEEAFALSCNTYFINLGKMLGGETILETMRKLELDKNASADFISESENFFPCGDFSCTSYLANISFGQGDLCLSPLDMTRIIIAVSTGNLAELCSIEGEIRDGVFIKNEARDGKRVFCEDTCKKMRRMMRTCVDAGTGKHGKISGANTGGKTATAQTGRFTEDGVEYVHKWFCGVYPIENPRISVCVLIDNETDENVSPSVIFGKICLFLLENGI